jgi:hypothetical protein
VYRGVAYFAHQFGRINFVYLPSLPPSLPLAIVFMSRSSTLYVSGLIDKGRYSQNEYWLELEARLREDFNIPGLRLSGACPFLVTEPVPTSVPCTLNWCRCDKE